MCSFGALLVQPFRFLGSFLAHPGTHGTPPGDFWAAKGILGNSRKSKEPLVGAVSASHSAPWRRVDRIPVSRDPVHSAPGGFFGGAGGDPGIS